MPVTIIPDLKRVQILCGEVKLILLDLNPPKYGKRQQEGQTKEVLTINVRSY